ncbi:MAG: DoxX family protein [Acidobacteriota bacterium]
MRILKAILKFLLAVFFVFGGVNHFRNPSFYLGMMPPYLPWHLPLVYVSGVFEMLFGLMLMIPKLTRLAAWGLILLLIAIFPANIYMAQHPALFPWTSPTFLLIRLPLQLVLLGCAYWFTRPERGAQTQEPAGGAASSA